MIPTAHQVVFSTHRLLVNALLINIVFAKIGINLLIEKPLFCIHQLLASQLLLVMVALLHWRVFGSNMLGVREHALNGGVLHLAHVHIVSGRASHILRGLGH